MDMEDTLDSFNAGANPFDDAVSATPTGSAAYSGIDPSIDFSGGGSSFGFQQSLATQGVTPLSVWRMENEKKLDAKRAASFAALNQARSAARAQIQTFNDERARTNANKYQWNRDQEKQQKDTLTSGQDRLQVWERVVSLVDLPNVEERMRQVLLSLKTHPVKAK
eukprot:gnl/Hemi2/25612_TR8605_c0_g1_i1.p1 gnl/Hemi2/25612_TR8605_c0_g1~~gnl/Hemi2/25612_TR8605_c0_g1_i1.p1  ORF type:complete len:178 (+),score=74.23 gnl/Hemi2/25612_TR8605_c0_g1_i1:42-536(+)